MATLTLTGSGFQDHTADSVANVDVIEFDSDPPSLIAQFLSSQFGASLISPTVDIVGDANSNGIVVQVSGTFSAAGWTFTNWSGSGDLTISNPSDFIGLFAGAGNDTLTGSAMSDILSGGADDDVLNGGGGFDIADYQQSAGVTVSLAVAGAQNTVGAGMDTLSNIESLLGSNTGGDTLTGNGLRNILSGGGGNDTLNGLDGNDVLDGGNDNDILNGGSGDDTLSGGAGDDTVNGDAGNDTANYGAAGAGVTVSLANQGVAQNTGGAGLDTLTGIENLTGSQHNDTLTGDGNANVLNGGLGDDTLNGASGLDTASYQGATSGVTVSLALIGSPQNTIGAGNDTLVDIENLIGSSLGDTLTGNGFANVLEGGLGNDTLNGGLGLDTASYSTSTAGVKVNLALGAQNTVGAGTDTLTSIENLIGSAFNDTLTGNTGANTISGAAGTDVITGGRGKDTMTGGAARDLFDLNSIKESVKGSNRDQIMDFQRGTDDIDLKTIDAKTGVSGNQKFKFIGKQGFHDVKGELRYIDKGASCIVQGDVNGDGKADFEIFVKVGSLGSGDFLL